MIKVIYCTVNGKVREIAVDERESLTDMLRLRLGLTSVKKGCEAGECGACTVLIDGVAKNSCILLAVWADGHEIITVEGIRGKNGLLHPVQQAFVDEAAIQCGFCTPGLVLTGVELVNSGKRYTREQLREKISGHLCRCTGYENILNALEKVVGVDSLANQEAKTARAGGNTPFGAILVDDVTGEVLMRQGNAEGDTHDATAHAEFVLASRASRTYSKEKLWKCTLYTTCEPCPMCTGGIYWANIGRIVYGISEARLLELTGADDKNPTFSMGADKVIAAGQKAIRREGPVLEMETEIVAVHEGFWNKK